MKKLLMLGLLVISSVYTQSNTFAKPRRSENKAKPCISIDKEIRSMMNYSDFNTNDEKVQGAVVVKYSIDENDKINITEMQSNDQRLKDYVYAKLNGRSVCNTNSDTTPKIVKISFLIR